MLGESAGRSADNGPRGNARRRFSDAERLQNTPLLDDPDYWEGEKLPPRVRIYDWFQDTAFSFIVGVMFIMLLIFAQSSTHWLASGGRAAIVIVGTLGCTRAYNLARRYQRKH